ncbi:MAG: hypothetical protein ABIH67_00930 [Candidatus Uhrbacteria bacterium]
MQRLIIIFQDNNQRIYKNVQTYKSTNKDQGTIIYADGSQEKVQGVNSFEYCKSSATFIREDGVEEQFSDINKIVRLPYGFFQIIFNNNEIHYLPMLEIKKIKADPEITILDIEHIITKEKEL